MVRRRAWLRWSRCGEAPRRGTIGVGLFVTGMLWLMVLGATLPATADTAPPERVVSINLCTDQLALMVAAEGQVISVFRMSRDPAVSMVAGIGRNVPINRGLAEEVLLLEPDLVVAGAFSNPQAVALLRDLGVRVEVFQPAASFDAIRENTLRMGQLLGRQEQASRIVAEMDRRLLGFRSDGGEMRPEIAIYSANNVAFGPGTLADDVVRHAGFANLAERIGFSGVGRLPLEVLIAEAPDVILGRMATRSGPALAGQNARHPAVTKTLGTRTMASLEDRFWLCGTPATVEAVEQLAKLRRSLLAREP